LLIVLLCGVYPLVVWGIAQAVFPTQANGSLITNAAGTVIGSELIGQSFTDARYFHPRPSAAGNGYDGTSSGGSNFGPLSQKLIDQVTQRVADYRALNGVHSSMAIPADAVTASASGLDPHISLANARLQAPRVAEARNISIDRVHSFVEGATVGRAFGILGEPGVNVLMLNLALDKER
jgi:K+-transporting ATPase ATPase C chain